MPKKRSKYELREQPIHWGRALICGAIGAAFMMAFIDIFAMMGLTSFSYETYLGSLILYDSYNPQSWILGFIMNCVCGAVFGILYAYCFEYVFLRSSSRLGIILGVWHAMVAALAFFPFFNAIHEFTGIPIQGDSFAFGFLGSKMGNGAVTPILLVTGNLLFGICLGTFYGSVRYDRVRARVFEPGETGVPPELGGISLEEDPEDRVAA